MSDKIEPAMTVEEWQAMLADDEFPSGLLPIHVRLAAVRGQSASDYLVKMVATFNAALPDDDPRKITHDDVLLLLGERYNGFVGDRPELWGAMKRLAIKLEALLPPDITTYTLLPPE